MRCDLNVPMRDGVITDDGRIRASLQTVRALQSRGATIVLMSHLGRPDGTFNPELSLKPVATRLSELLGEPVAFVEGMPGEAAKSAASWAQPGGVALLENLRFDPRETSKDPHEREAFANELAALGEAYVSDGFGVVHRAQASVTDLAKALPSAAGTLVSQEVEVLERLVRTPDRPFTVILGGSKVSDKLGVIDNLLVRVDSLLIGGGMVFTFLAATGLKVGASLLEIDQIERVQGYLERAKQLGVHILLPTDIVVADRFAADAAHEVVSAATIEESRFGTAAMGLDIGPSSANAYADVIRSSRTVFWNGPMGVFEFDAFSSGTRAVAAALTEVDGLAVVGGGDSAAAIRQLGFSDDDFGHVSTGGGASLELLEGKNLPGLEVLGWQ